MARHKPLDPAVKEQMTEVAGLIVEIISAQEEVFTPEGMHTLPQKGKDNAYKQKPMAPGTEHMLSGAYVGARGQIIFCFEPVDAVDYKHFEVEAKKIDDVFPTFAPLLAEAIGSSKEMIGDVIVDVATLIAQKHEDTERKKEEEKIEQTKAYEDHPDFGRF